MLEFKTVKAGNVNLGLVFGLFPLPIRFSSTSLTLLALVYWLASRHPASLPNFFSRHIGVALGTFYGALIESETAEWCLASVH